MRLACYICNTVGPNVIYIDDMFALLLQVQRREHIFWCATTRVFDVNVSCTEQWRLTLAGTPGQKALAGRLMSLLPRRHGAGAIYILDIAYNFRTAFIVVHNLRRSVVRDRVLIAEYYMRYSTFWPDLLAALPLVAEVGLTQMLLRPVVCWMVDGCIPSLRRIHTLCSSATAYARSCCTAHILLVAPDSVSFGITAAHYLRAAACGRVRRFCLGTQHQIQ